MISRNNPAGIRQSVGQPPVSEHLGSEHTLPSRVEENISPTSGTTEQPAVHGFRRWIIVLIAVAIVLSWLAAALLLAYRNALPGKDLPEKTPSEKNRSVNSKPSAASAQAKNPGMAPGGPPQQWTAGEKGPWGQLETMPFTLDVPDGFVLGPPAPPVRWSFPGYDREKVLATLRSVGIPDEEVNRLNGSAKWNSQEGVVSIEPGDPLVLGLAPEVRAKLYAILVEFPQNAAQIVPTCFRRDNIDRRFQDSRLAPKSIALFKRLLYPQGEKTLVFADFDTLLRSLPDDAERTRFMKTSLRQRTLLARLRLDPGADVEALAQYWGIGGRRKDLLPFLGDLSRSGERSSIGIICLLPEFARQRLFLHPSTAGDKGVMQDCFWTAYNFFNDPPDNSYADTHSNAGLNKDCYQIASPNQLGDLMILTTSGGSAVHAAVFLADNIYFTKNGLNPMQPWILIYRDDLLEEYRALHPGNLEIRYFRRKGF